MQNGPLLPPPPPSVASQPASGALRQRRSIFASAEMAGAGSGASATSACHCSIVLVAHRQGSDAECGNVALPCCPLP